MLGRKQKWFSTTFYYYLLSKLQPFRSCPHAAFSAIFRKKDPVVVRMSEMDENMLKANVLKEEGNALLSANKYALAAEKYSEAIEICPTAIFHSNRAQALIKLESYGLAIEDANQALT